MSVLAACLSVHKYVPGACGDQKRATDPLNWSYRQVVSCQVVLGIEPAPSGRAVNALNC